jgi:predicted N-acetyltransferase YhbS
MSREFPMDAAEEAAFFNHIAKIEALREERRQRLELERLARADQSLPVFLRPQAE